MQPALPALGPRVVVGFDAGESDPELVLQQEPGHGGEPERRDRAARRLDGDRTLELGHHLAHDVDGLGLEALQVGKSLIAYSHGTIRWSDVISGFRQGSR
mgnify:CR=1 FL=1